LKKAHNEDGTKRIVFAGFGMMRFVLRLRFLKTHIVYGLKFFKTSGRLVEPMLDPASNKLNLNLSSPRC
jgi:hypothetical protein